MSHALTGVTIFDGEAMADGDTVVITDGRVSAVMDRRDLSPAMPRRDLGGGLLAPGFVDMQINGGGGVLLNEDPTAAGVRRIAAAHRRFGTTGLLPTVITDAPSVMAKAMAAVRAARAEGLASVLGLHFEGPFIDSERKGAHAARFIRELTDEDANIIASAACGTVLLTLAPNRVRPELIRALTIRGVIVSLGHAEASHAQCQAALAAGATCFTHLFNAMSQVNGREPGMVGSALADSDCFVSIIADGFHVHDATLKVAIAAKRKDRMILVSDAMPSAAGGPDQFELQGRPVTRRGGRLELDDGTLAGSDLTMDAAVRHCVNHLGMTVADALRMATRNPAALLGRGGELGRIAPGYLANLVHLGEDLTVREVWTTDE